MPKLDSYLKKAISLGVSEAKLIDVKNVMVGEWVRLKCQYGCGGYGQCLTCPPYSPPPEFTRKLLADYKTGLLLQIRNISWKEDEKILLRFKNIIADLEREIFLDGYYKAFGMTAGPCLFCRTCDTSRVCKYPRRARPAMEACGIDVYQTARNAGMTLEVVKSRESLCSYLSLILIE